MQPTMRFCKAPDGTRIGYAVLGEGQPLVLLYSWGNNPETEWRNPRIREAYEQLTDGRQAIVVMRRGFGASQREVEDLSLGAQMSDLGAVVDAVGLSAIDLWAFGDATGAAVGYAVHNPGRVTRLVLWDAYVRGKDVMPENGVRALMALSRDNWGMARRAMADVVFPSGPVDDQRWLSEQWKESIDPEMMSRYLEFGLELDVSEYLPHLSMPTLLITRRGDRFAPPAQARAAATLIPGARFIASEGDIAYAWFGDTSYIETVREFLDEGREASAATPPRASPVQTILFTDLEGHTGMMSKLGDEKGRTLLREHERITRKALAEHGGQEVKSMGDGFMAKFDSAQRGVECAIALQRAISALETEPFGYPGGLKVRAGLNAGEPIVEDADIFGSSVIAAARISAKARGGQVLVADVVRQLVAGKGFLFHDTGQHDLKGLEDPVRLWELRWEE